MSNSTPHPAPDEHAKLKQEAGEYAAGFVRPGMAVGLGTGSTAIFATRRIAELFSQGRLQGILGFATSTAVREEAIRLGIPMADEGMPRPLDVAIDGADEVDPGMNLIKGGGGALFREKIVAQASARFLVIVDDSKMSPRLGTIHVLPVEVLPFGSRSQIRFLESLGARIAIRKNPDGSPYVTDSGNMIADCDFGPLANPTELAERLSSRAGIVEHGLFIGLATDLIVAGREGLRHLKR